ncbi:LysM domain protein [Aspergillus sclerotialis]|uniref:LysM domain protein n=1 Tax=Aspergillus sclerotialis TaxID=2070753 RepID=A0A3A2ZMY3_9EURO|nr:LysM domain protein [Aspergillus sclerotialis]
MLYIKSTIALGLLPQLLAARSIGHVRRSVECSFSTAANSGDTCESFASDWGISVDTLKSLNPDLDCDNFDESVNYCVMGTVTSGDNSTTTSSTTAPSITKATTSTNSLTTTTSNPHSPTQPGLAENCDKFHKVISGDQCGTIEAQYGITGAQFSKWNPYIDDGCTNLWLDYYVCVHVPGAQTTGPGTTKPTEGPSPTQPGIAENCDEYHKVVSGDQCVTIESKYQISDSQFSKWNPYINDDCTNLWLDYYVCVHVPGASTTSPQPTPTPNGPRPQMPNITKDCKKFHKVQSGEGCYAIEQENNITPDQFLKWNPYVDATCTNLWAGYYVCVGV